MDAPLATHLAGQEIADQKQPWWRSNAPLLTGLVIALLLYGALFAREIQAAVDVWNASTAYSHCYLILPMALFLIWDRRQEVRNVVIRPQAGWAFLAIPIGLFWLLCDRLGIMEGRQLAAVAGVEVLLLSVLGADLFQRLLGPLLFLVFLVPFGAFLTPALQRFTAWFSIVGLDILGIPNFSDQFTIETPAGVFFVAEACAGLRFLVAAIAFGVFYALLTYTSIWRRAAFMALSVVVPIVANGFRALGIIVLGQVLGSAEAAAADHIIYGWLFFSCVMLMLIAAGQLFRDRHLEPKGDRTASLQPRQRPRTIAAAAAAVLCLLAVGPAIAAAIDGQERPTAPLPASVFQSAAGCAPLPSDASTVASIVTLQLQCGNGRYTIRAETFSDRETFGALLSARRRVTQEIGAENVTVLPLQTQPGTGAWTLVQTTDPNRTTAYASWVDGQPGRGGLSQRLTQARDSLLGGSNAAVLITVTAAAQNGETNAHRRNTVDELQALLNAQAGLDERIAQASRLGSTKL